MAILADVVSFLSSHIHIILPIILIIHLGHNYFTPGARSIPGPFIAKITNLWRYIDVARGRPETTLYELHKKHGDYVRLGPNVISISNPELLKEIYGINKGYMKVTILFPSNLLPAIDNHHNYPRYDNITD